MAAQTAKAPDQTWQSHESALSISLVPICFAPEAQWSLAPRFSVGKWVSMSLSALEGRRERPSCHPDTVHAIALPGQTLAPY
jgi:hypothetical protein